MPKKDGRKHLRAKYKGLFFFSLFVLTWLMPTMKAFPNKSASMPFTALGKSESQGVPARGTSTNALATFFNGKHMEVGAIKGHVRWGQ